MHSIESLSLKEEADQSLAEARMILPGMQALLGFQTIAVFNQRFEELTHGAQYLHLLSLLMIVAAIVLAMTPAALFRTAAGRFVTRGLLKRTTVLLTCAMLSLSLSLGLDSYVVATLVFDSRLACILFAAFVLLLCWAAWFLFPLWCRSFHIKRKG